MFLNSIHDEIFGIWRPESALENASSVVCEVVDGHNTIKLFIKSKPSGLNLPQCWEPRQVYLSIFKL